MNKKKFSFSSKKKSKLIKQEVLFSNSTVKPVFKCKKHLTILLFFYQLEKIIGKKIFFKFRNICVSLFNSKLTSSSIFKLYSFLINKFLYFKYQFKEENYLNTIMFLVHLFKFKRPDSLLLASYISSILPFLQKHTQFLLFIKRILQILQKIFIFGGVRILIAGKLNGFSRSQSKQIQIGRVTLQSSDLFYSDGYSQAFTTAGKIGVKV